MKTMATVFEKKQVALEWDGAWCCRECGKAHHWTIPAYVNLSNGNSLCYECAKVIAQKEQTKSIFILDKSKIL